MIRERLMRLFPFLSRWFEVAPACCGVCSTCVTTTAGTLLLPIVTASVAGKALQADADSDPSDPANP
jgi:hypothetical protein